MSGSLQSLCWGSSAFGGIVSSYFSGSLVGSYGVRYVGWLIFLIQFSWTLDHPSHSFWCQVYCIRFVFGVTALLPLLTSAVAILVKEQPVVGPVRGQAFTLISPSFYESSKQNIIQLWAAVRQRNIFLPTLFIFLWQATPQSDSAMFYFTYVVPLIVDILPFTFSNSTLMPQGHFSLFLSIFCQSYQVILFQHK